MKVTKTALSGVLLIEPTLFKDSRGFFFESYRVNQYAENGIAEKFVQDNISHSTQNVLRGLHYQLEHAQGKLVFVTRGKVMDVIVDLRKNSPTFKKSVCVILEDQKPQQVYIPPGFAHGFCVLSETADFYYKCTDYYYPKSEFGVRWDDPDLNINWPIDSPILSPKDAANPFLKDIPDDQLPQFK